MTPQPSEQPRTAALITAGEELFAIAYAALLQDAVDNHLTNEAMTAWTRAVAAARKAEAAAPDPVASPLDGATVVRLLHSVGNTLAGWTRRMDGYDDAALAHAIDFVIRYPDPQERIAAARLEGQPVAESPDAD